MPRSTRILSVIIDGQDEAVSNTHIQTNADSCHPGILISEVNLLYYRFNYGILLLIYLSDTWTSDNHKSNCQII